MFKLVDHLHFVSSICCTLYTVSDTYGVQGSRNTMVSPIQDGREPLNSINGVSPMLSGRIDPLSTPLYNGRNKLFPPVAPTTRRKQLVSPIVQRSR